MKTRQQEEGDDVNKSQLARDVGMKRANVRQWMEGRTPYAVTGVETAHEPGLTARPPIPRKTAIGPYRPG